MATLYIVATPIGNLKDITIRALETFRGVDLIACEDTRRTRKLLTAHDIRKPLLSCHAHGEAVAAEEICDHLAAGRDVAYASDAGTPSVSDPGTVLARTVRGKGHSVIPVPGPCAATTIASIAGIPGKTVVFEGFLSPKAGRRRGRLRELIARNETFVIYESPHRIIKLLQDLADLEPDRELMLGREMTKMHEQYIHATAQEMVDIVRDHTTQRGEFTVLVGGGKNT